MTRRRKRTTQDIIQMKYAKGMTEREIAAVTGIPKTTIHNTLQKTENQPLVTLYKERRADIFAEKQAEIIQSLDHETIKEMSGLQRITGLGILYDKERLERGQSTENVDIRTLSVSLDGKIEELRSLLMPTSGAVEDVEMQD